MGEVQQKEHFHEKDDVKKSSTNPRTGIHKRRQRDGGVWGNIVVAWAPPPRCYLLALTKYRALVLG